MIDFLQTNWHPIMWVVYGLIEFIVRLIPSENDNSPFNRLKKVLDVLIPNAKKQPKEEPPTTIQNKETLKKILTTDTMPPKEQIASLINSYATSSPTH